MSQSTIQMFKCRRTKETSIWTLPTNFPSRVRIKLDFVVNLRLGLHGVTPWEVASQKVTTTVILREEGLGTELQVSGSFVPRSSLETIYGPLDSNGGAPKACSDGNGSIRPGVADLP